MLIEHDDARPRIDESAWVAPSAVVSGDVRIGPHSRVLHGAVLTAESGPIVIGRRCIVMEQAVVRGTRHHPVTVDDHVLVGPHAYLSGCTVHERAFLATGSAVFNGATIGERAEVRIRGTVHVNSRVEDGGLVPIGWIAIGDPAQVFPPEAHEEIWEVQKTLDFPGTVFGMDRGENGRTDREEMALRYTRALGRHADDRIIDEHR